MCISWVLVWLGRVNTHQTRHLMNRVESAGFDVYWLSLRVTWLRHQRLPGRQVIGQNWVAKLWCLGPTTDILFCHAWAQSKKPHQKCLTIASDGRDLSSPFQVWLPIIGISQGGGSYSMLPNRPTMDWYGHVKSFFFPYILIKENIIDIYDLSRDDYFDWNLLNNHGIS